ncbi:MAG: hypothetical protein WCG29_11750 [Desulfomonile sp.]|jgi:Mrp family chromosome partitioning ATPase|nr:hypothetical protein [Deltaproteobacteria bacterium]
MTAQLDQFHHDFKERFRQLSETDLFRREMDILWASVRNKLGKEGRRSFLVCSASIEEGNTTITMGLGKFVANQTGKNVLLVDAHCEGNVLGDLLADDGLVPLIEEPEDRYALTFDEFETSIPNLRYLTFRNPRCLDTLVVNSEDMAVFFNLIRKRYDYVFVDAPPVLASNVAPFLARQLDNVIFVIAASTRRYPVLKEALSRLEDSSDRILGAVLNKREYPVPEYVYRFIR